MQRFLGYRSEVLPSWLDSINGAIAYRSSHDRVGECCQGWVFERLKDTYYFCQPLLFSLQRVVEKNGLLDEPLNCCTDCACCLRVGKVSARLAYANGKRTRSRLCAEDKALGAGLRCADKAAICSIDHSTVSDQGLLNCAHVVVGQHPGGPVRSIWVVVEIGVRSLLAALRWNW